MSKKTKIRFAPKYVQKIIVEKGLNEITDDNLKAKIFLSEMFKMKIRGSTIINYFKIIKPVHFPNTTIIPNSMAFDTLTPSQNRNPNFRIFDNLIRYIKLMNNSYKWPLLLSHYTGLRLMEIFQIKSSHIIMITKKQKTIPIYRKNKEVWNVVYYEMFEDFIHHLRHFIFKEECDIYLESNRDSFIFKYISKYSLNNKLRECYTMSNNGLEPPNGFGVHFFRYYAASKIVKNIDGSGGIRLAQLFLGHKNIKTTKKYVKLDVNIYKERLNAINLKNAFYLKICKKLEDSKSCNKS